MTVGRIALPYFPDHLQAIRHALFRFDNVQYNPSHNWKIAGNYDNDCYLAECFGIDQIDLSRPGPVAEALIQVRFGCHRLVSRQSDDCNGQHEFLNLLPIFYPVKVTYLTEEVNIQMIETATLPTDASPNVVAEKIWQTVLTRASEMRQILSAIKM